jgi:hypothetical protein
MMPDVGDVVDILGAIGVVGVLGNGEGFGVLGAVADIIGIGGCADAESNM